MSLSTFETTIRIYIEERLKESFPSVEFDSNDTLSDLFIDPLVELLKPFMSFLARVDYVQNLSNATYMTAAELDIIGEGNYGITRTTGNPASGYVYIEMDPEYVGTDPIVIGPLTVSTADGLLYTSSVSTIIKYAESDVVGVAGTTAQGVISDYLNVSTGEYEFPIYVVSESSGSIYNAVVGSINTLVTPYALLTGNVSNQEEFTNGTDAESNTEYAERIKQVFASKNVGTYTWYRSYIKSAFEAVIDVYIAGYRHDLMERDTITVREGGVMTAKHIGGKTDVYIKGAIFDTFAQEIYVSSDKIRLQNPLLVSADAIVVTNLTDPTNNDLQVTLEYEDPTSEDSWVNAQVIAGVSTTLPTTGDELEIKYISYLTTDYEDTCLYVQTLYYNSNRVRLYAPPFEAITAITNNTTATVIPVVDETYFTTETVLPLIETGTLPSQAGVITAEVQLEATNSVDVDNYYVDTTIAITEGTGAGQSAVFTAYDGDTLVGTVTPVWSPQPDNTSVYTITDHTNYCENSAKDKVDIILDIAATIGEPPATALNAEDQVTISYTYNKLVSDIQYDIDVDENRMAVNDMLAREAIPRYIYMGMYVKTKSGRALTTTQKSLIQQCIEDIITATDFDETMELSDIIYTINSIPDITNFLEYIQMPIIYFSSLTVLSYEDDALMALSGSDYEQSLVSFANAQYPVLGQLVIEDVV